MSTPPSEPSLRLVELACLAPSVHNTQPWKWRASGDSVELYADRARQLHATDPDGRNLAISCGAALHHGIVVAHALGQSTDVTLVPEPTERDLLARIRLSPGVTPDNAVETLDLIGLRRTDRRRFTAWPVPDARLGVLAQAASGWGAQVIPVVDVILRHRTELLLDRALRSGVADEQAVGEQRLAIDRGQDDGMRLLRSTDGLVVICTETDDQRAWIEAGQSLSALWLRATRDGLSIVPLRQVTDVAETRQALLHDVLADATWPQLLVRVGWQEISRSDLPRTARRPLADVLVA